MYKAERVLFDLLRGRAVWIMTPGADAATPGTVGEGSVLVAAVEGLSDGRLRELRGLSGSLRLALTSHRARAMGLPLTGDEATGMSFLINADATEADIFRLSTAAGDYAAVTLGLEVATPCEAGGLSLARAGRVLPAIMSVTLHGDDVETVGRWANDGTVLSVTTDEIEGMTSRERLEVTYVSDGPVPLVDAEDARFMSFRGANGILEHVAVLVGPREEWPDPLPVRIHSACLTGDLFGSLRCDCGEQLRGALRVFQARGGGVLLYLDQEGRGIGFGNKLRAYTLQDEGLDTMDADCTLGFGADERRYDSAVAMLHHLEIDRIQLLTNNPEKIRAVRTGGIQVVDRQPLYGTLNRHNRRYVRAKVQRAGHWLGDMLSGAVSGK